MLGIGVINTDPYFDEDSIALYFASSIIGWIFVGITLGNIVSHLYNITNGSFIIKKMDNDK